jgi:D-alanyl-lipoteichoic acid acyltransferase DltB (MBOAT superfamily)
MLFNSFVFLFVFLPLSLLLYYGSASISYRLAAASVGFSSLLFYSWWDFRFVFLLVGSIGINYALGREIGIAKNRNDDRRARSLFIAGIAIDLATLAFFKYSGLLSGSVQALTGIAMPLPEIVLPLGISFYTFTQIAFLADAQQGKVREYDFIYYVAFVTYFPHQIAGPILHHREMIDQFRLSSTYSPTAANFAVGLTIFTFGLFKKVVLADNVADFATPVFGAADAGNQMKFMEAWLGAIAYAFQIYFDFSGYSDMAIGLSLLFGIKLPLNFNSPYKSTSITEFWRRWHMTLSRFLRDYLYIPLGGSRRGSVRRYANLLATMVLGGLWHGASWTFAAWGLLHGTYLVVNHAWRAVRPSLALLDAVPGSARHATAWLVTMISVVVAWVFFRSKTFDGAHRMLLGMAGVNGITLPPELARFVPSTGFIRMYADATWTGAFGPRIGILLLLLLFAISVLLPNTQQLLRQYRPALDQQSDSPTQVLLWRPTVYWAIACGSMFALALNRIGGYSEFLYFNF